MADSLFPLLLIANWPHLECIFWAVSPNRPICVCVSLNSSKVDGRPPAQPRACVSFECCFSPAFMHDEAVGFSLNKSPGHIKGWRRFIPFCFFALCVSCPITTSVHKVATAACVVRRQRRYSKKKKIYSHILLINVSQHGANWQSVDGCKTSTTEEKPVWPILLLPICFIID